MATELVAVSDYCTYAAVACQDKREPFPLSSAPKKSRREIAVPRNIPAVIVVGCAMTARWKERSERTCGRRAQRRRRTMAWLHRASAACYNLATETTRKNRPARFLAGRHSRLIIFSLLAHVRSFVATAFLGRRAQAGGRREGFSFLPNGRFLISMPYRACGSGAAHSSGNLKRYLYSGSRKPVAFLPHRAPRGPRAALLPASVPRFPRSFVRSPQHDVFRAPVIFGDGNGNRWQALSQHPHTCTRRGEE